MASALSSPSTASYDLDKMEVWKDMLYDEMMASGSEQRLYSQKDLVALNVVPDGDLQLLMKIVQALTNDKLLRPVTDTRQGLLCWRWRSAEEAQKYDVTPRKTPLDRDRRAGTDT